MFISKNKTHLVGTFKFSSWGFYIINKYKHTIFQSINLDDMIQKLGKIYLNWISACMINIYIFLMYYENKSMIIDNYLAPIPQQL